MTDLELLRDATEVDGAEVSRLRRRVMEQVERRKRRRWLWMLCPAAAGIVLALLWPRPAALETLEIAVRTPQAPPLRVVAAEARPKPLPRRGRNGRGQTVIQLETADPDVVIYLVASNGGEE